jgi:hypothetical protein
MYVSTVDCKKKSSTLKVRKKDLHVLKNRKISAFDFYDVLDFFAIGNRVFNFCFPKTDSDNWRFRIAGVRIIRVLLYFVMGYNI